MKMSLFLALMMLSMCFLEANAGARRASVDPKILLEKAEKLDQYASLGYAEMVSKTDEIHDLIVALHNSVLRKGSRVSSDVREKVLQHIQNYKKAEKEMVAAQRAAKRSIKGSAK